MFINQPTRSPNQLNQNMSINQALASSISQIVDDRLKNSFEIRDNVLSQMHQSLEAVASLLRGKFCNNYTIILNDHLKTANTNTAVVNLVLINFGF